ncbi:hypothetical protein IFR05_007802 [Cadophora sp. M221]|nr:hypothetical protein IFR05_007802 [Cadophora sp. M221]
MCLNILTVFIASLLSGWLSKSVEAQALSSFYYGKGPGVVAHDPSTGNFLYSVYTNKGFSDIQPLTVKTKPKNGTAIACSGYQVAQSVYGEVFYQAQNDSIIFLFMKCSFTSGVCVNYGERTISVNVTVPVNSKTKLAAALFSQNVGYRVTYQDALGSIRQLAYANSTKGVVTNWAEGILTGNFTVPDGYGLATSIRKPTNVTSQREIVYQVMADGVQPITSKTDNKTMSILDQKTWFANPRITSFPNFSPSKATLAAILYNGWDCIFYIDTNRQLQFMSSADGGTSWSLQPQELPTVWPLADEPNGPIAAAASINTSDFSAYVYYNSGKRLVQAKIEGSTWQPIAVVESVPTLSGGAPNPSTPNHDKKNATAIKAGAGTSAAVIFVIVVGVAAWCLRRKNRPLRSEIDKPDGIFGREPSERGFTGKAELPGQPANITELDHDPECLLLHQLQLRRLGELRAGIPGELAGKDIERRELDAGLCRYELDGKMGIVYELWSPVGECALEGCLGNGAEKCKTLVTEVAKELGGGTSDSSQCNEKEKGLGDHLEYGNNKSTEAGNELPGWSKGEPE